MHFFNFKYNLYNKHPQIKQLNELKKNVKDISMKYNFKFIDGENIFINLDNPLKVFHYELRGINFYIFFCIFFYKYLLSSLFCLFDLH